MIDHARNAFQIVLIDVLIFSSENFLEMLTSLLANVVFTLYPISIFINNFVNKEFPSPPPYNGVKILRIGVAIFKLLKLSFLFQNVVFKLEKLNILSIEFMKSASI